MKVKDILNAIDQGLQNLGSFTYLDFKAPEILLQFNTIAKYHSRRHFEKIMPQDAAKMFEGVRLNIDDLRHLKVLGKKLVYQQEKWLLPDDYERFGSLSATGEWCRQKRVSRVVEVGTQDIARMLQSPLAKPKPDTLLCVIAGREIKVYSPEKYILEGLSLDYLRMVKEARQDTDWEEYPEDVMVVLIDATVRRLLELTQSQRYQSKAVENTL